MNNLINFSKKNKKQESVIDTGFSQALKTFHEAANRVPAYKDFLQKHAIRPERIKTLSDFKTLPIVTKENYLKAYPLKQLLWDGNFKDAHIISMSSGSSGQPFFWPRGDNSLLDCIGFHQSIFDNLEIRKDKEVLVIIAFAMGTWIAGTYTLAAIEHLTKKGYNLTAMTPGIDKHSAVRILEKMGPEFDQVILFGYPPFTKDIVDAAIEEKVKLKQLNLKIITAGENISEKWRNYMLKKIGASDPLRTVLNIYGTADAGLLGCETPLSIYTRRIAEDKQKVFNSLFPDANVLPTFVAYNPHKRFFEEIDGDIVFTCNNSLPLIRYQILDQGKLFTADELFAALDMQPTQLPSELRKYTQDHHVALYGRHDVATTFYALDIFPENIKRGLEQPSLQKYVTGKFIIETIYHDETQEQSLHLTIETKSNVSVTPELTQKVLKYVIAGLKEHNIEYNALYHELGKKANPTLHFIESGSPDFDLRVKHRWVRN
jgi:phenylacetate-CoA ligase